MSPMTYSLLVSYSASSAVRSVFLVRAGVQSLDCSVALQALLSSRISALLQGLPDGGANRSLLAAARRLESYDAPFAPAAMHVTAADCRARMRDIGELVRSPCHGSWAKVVLIGD